MKLKYLILIVVLMAGMTACSQSRGGRSGGRDEGGPPPDRKQELQTPDEKITVLTKRLNLTSDQVEQIRPVLKEEYDELKKIEESDEDSKDIEKRRSDIDWIIYKKMNKILTEEQMYLYLQYVESQKKTETSSGKSGRGGSGGGRGGPPGGGGGRF
ncbi:hypothetical protein [Maridesulfovibrio frigidus]|uniref:hypothetical protein n=1 Tax=Maridesulfovibrio frigidus TaxID=340956 RepID=UPI0004E226EE|nr:hypothetical protein [Maridesulfovibrio frigidus]